MRRRAAVGTLASADSQGPVYISNSGDLTVDYITALGAVNVSSAGTLSTATVAACDCTTSISGSSVTLSSSGSMLVSSGYTVTASDGVSLYAGYDASSGAYTNSSDTLTVAGNVSGSTVGLFSGGAVTGALTQTPFQYSSVPPPPTLDQCIAAPTLAGCSAVLPTLAECTATPIAPGCGCRGGFIGTIATRSDPWSARPGGALSRTLCASVGWHDPSDQSRR